MLLHVGGDILKNPALLQYLICAVGAVVALMTVWAGFGLKSRWPARRRAIDVATYLGVALLGCVMLFAPFNVLQGDGQIHQAKVAYLADAIRHGRLPEWTFLWFGGSDVSECYGPLSYVLVGAFMALTGFSSKIAFALTVFAAYLTIIIVAPRNLTRRYSEPAAAIAALCFLLSPAHAGLYWWDGRPHVIIIDLICALYVIYLISMGPDPKGLRKGVALGLSASLCVCMHLQYGALATLLLFAYTTFTTGLTDRLTIEKNNIISLLTTLMIAGAMFCLFAIPHYIYYYRITPDMVASANSALDMFSMPADRWPTLLAEIQWGAWSGNWDAHYVGLIPLALSAFAIVRLFRRDRFAVFGGLFALGLFASAIFLRRNAAFLPIFYLPAVAGAIDVIRARLARQAGQSVGAPKSAVTPGDASASERRGAFVLAVMASLILIDLAPSNFISPYRPGAGAKPLIAELKSESATIGRTLTVGPNGGYSLLMTDEKRRGRPLEIPSFFGPTSQLSTKLYGLTATAARLAWLDHARTGTIDPRLTGLLSLLDISRVVFYGQQKDIQVIDIPTARPAWRIGSFVCDSRPTPLAKITWDTGRSIGEGSIPVQAGVLGDLKIDAVKGVVDGVHVNCDSQGAAPRLLAQTDANPATADLSDRALPVMYDEALEHARFGLITGRDGLFLMPFGYYRDLNVISGGKAARLYRTNDWMTVAALPAGAATITVSSGSAFRILVRCLDALLVLGVIYFVIDTLRRRRGAAAV